MPVGGDEVDEVDTIAATEIVAQGGRGQHWERAAQTNRSYEHNMNMNMICRKDIRLVTYQRRLSDLR